jgi:hypothetical protein
MRPRPRVERALAAALLIAASGCRAEQAAPGGATDRRPELGLMGTIPLYWGEAAAFGDALSGRATHHWARAQLEKRYSLRPLDTLSAESLAGLDFLLLAQPRALSGPENVALDEWVRAGGHLMLFADPLLTGESRFAIGDRRRPQGAILLSPILEHWGLRLEFDDSQREGPALVDGRIPVNLPGAFVSEGGCVTQLDGLLARCAIGEGQLLAVADSAVLDLYEPDPAAPAALDWLLEQGFENGTTRESRAGSRAGG